jgi:hypothetical protein
LAAAWSANTEHHPQAGRIVPVRFFHTALYQEITMASTRKRITEDQISEIYALYQKGTATGDIVLHTGFSLATIGRVIASLRGNLNASNPRINKLVYKVTGQNGAQRAAFYRGEEDLAEGRVKDTQGLVSSAAQIETAVIECLGEVESFEEQLIALLRQAEMIKNRLIKAKAKL